MVIVRKVESAKDFRRFIDFPETLYGDNPYYVPSLEFDVKDTLLPSRNPASEFCDSQMYLAFDGEKVVGRVLAIVNRRANGKWNHRQVRFGWFDFIDDRDVSAALIAQVEEFGRQRGMDEIVGPLGFTDFDPEGMLVEGYDRVCTMALIYNHPYYRDHIEALGFVKDVDWIEMKIQFPDKLPQRVTKIAELTAERCRLHNVKITRRMMNSTEFTHKIFNLINLCYKDLYNFTVMPEHLADKYIGFYVKLLPKEYMSAVENEYGELVAFGISMPSLAKALQKTRGKLLPFGWIEILKAMYGHSNEGIEFLLVGVRPDYQNLGVNSMLIVDVFSKLKSLGKKWAESNAVLEDNLKNQGMWKGFDFENLKRRRSYIKKIG